MAFDYKKEYKALYQPPREPQFVTVPAMTFAAVRGQGDPNDPTGEYKAAIELLYGLLYTIKMSKKGSHRVDGYFDFVVPPLEGLWEQTGTGKESFHWTSMLRLPEFVTKEVFDRAIRDTWSPTVRPPRLGGNTRMGVFATRSPFRPNPIALSCVKLAGIRQTAEGPVLRVRGADLVNGTPILDIKPYIPYADSHPNALGGFAAVPAGETLSVSIPPALLAQVPAERQEALRGVLAQDPRPHYQKDPERVYGFSFAGFEVRFTVDGNQLTVRDIRPAE